MSPSTSSVAVSPSSSSSSSSSLVASPNAVTTGDESIVAVPSAPAPVEPPTVDPTVAYERLLPRFAAMGTENLAAMNRDVPKATNIALKAVPKLLGYRAAFAKTFTAFDFDKLDILWDAAKATQGANAYLTATSVTEDALAPAFKACSDDHAYLLKVMETLVVIKKVPAKVLEEVNKLTGYTATATDILVMDAYLDTNWEKAGPKSGLTLEDRAAIRARAGHLQNMVNERQKAEARQGDATLRRMQAFTLLARSYEYVRTALAFVLLEQGGGSVDEIAPSLYTMTKARKSKGAGDGVDAKDGNTGSPSEPPAPVAPVVTNSVKSELATPSAATDEVPALGPAFGG
jgi:hypothetical protein